MTSKTETALLAFVAALKSKATAEPDVLPQPLRNQNLIAQLVEDAEGISRFVNVLDGDRDRPVDQVLGADLGVAAAYDIRWLVRVEFAVAGADDDAREAAFDAGRVAIWDAVKPAVSVDGVSYLDGAVDAIELVDMLPPDQSVPARAGLPNVKATEFVFALLYTSTDPF